MAEISNALWLSLAKTYMQGITLPHKGQEGYWAYVNADGTNFEYAPPANVLAPYTIADAGKRLVVNATGDAVEWEDTFEFAAFGADPATTGAVRLTEGEAITSNSSAGDVDIAYVSGTTMFVGDYLTNQLVRVLDNWYLYINTAAAYRFTATAFEPRGTSGTKSNGTATTRWADVHTVAVTASGYVSAGSGTIASSGTFRAPATGSVSATLPSGSGAWNPLAWDSSTGNCYLGVNTTPTGGSTGDTYVRAGSAVRFEAAGSARWALNASQLKPLTNNAYDIAEPATRLRNCYSVAGDFSGAVTVADLSATLLKMPITVLTLASGACSAAGLSHVSIDTEAAAATDDCDTISGGGVGQILIVHGANSAHDVTFKDLTGNLHLASGDFVMTTARCTLVLWHNGSYWNELLRVTVP